MTVRNRPRRRSCSWADGQTDEWTKGQAGGQTDIQKDRWIDGQTFAGIYVPEYVMCTDCMRVCCRAEGEY